MNREEKRVELELLQRHFSSAQIAVCAEYRGLSVAQMTNLRKELRDKGVFGRVTRNTLAKISAERAYSDANAAELKKFLNLLEGPNLLIFGPTDPIAPAKVLTAFKKDNEKLEVKGAWMGGSFVDRSGIETLSKMPGKQELMAQLLALIAAPATQLVRVIQAPGAQMVRLIEAHRKQLEGGGQ